MKAWKIAQLAGVLILLIGVVVRVGGETYGTALGVLGVLIFTVARLGAWIKSDGP